MGYSCYRRCGVSRSFTMSIDAKAGNSRTLLAASGTCLICLCICILSVLRMGGYWFCARFQIWISCAQSLAGTGVTSTFVQLFSYPNLRLTIDNVCDTRLYSIYRPFVYPRPLFSQIDIIGAMVIVWRARGKIIRSVLCSIVCNNCTQWTAHTYELN